MSIVSKRAICRVVLNVFFILEPKSKQCDKIIKELTDTFFFNQMKEIHWKFVDKILIKGENANNSDKIVNIFVFSME